MPRIKTRPSLRFRKRSFAESVEFPRWVVAASVLLIGFMLLLAGLSGPDGKLTKPGGGGYLYIGALAAVVITPLINPRTWSTGKRLLTQFIAGKLRLLRRSSPREGAFIRKTRVPKRRKPLTRITNQDGL